MGKEVSSLSIVIYRRIPFPELTQQFLAPHCRGTAQLVALDDLGGLDGAALLRHLPTPLRRPRAEDVKRTGKRSDSVDSVV